MLQQSVSFCAFFKNKNTVITSNLCHVDHVQCIIGYTLLLLVNCYSNFQIEQCVERSMDLYTQLLSVFT